MIETLIACAFVLAGAVWKFWDGHGRPLGNGVRSAVLVPLCIAAAGWAGLTWLAPYVGAVAALSLIVGHTEWKSWSWQPHRAAAMAALAVFPFGLDGATYIATCAIGSLAYPAFSRIDTRLPRFWLFDGGESYARLIFGAAVVGGLAFL